jgi:hypothetical protein
MEFPIIPQVMLDKNLWPLNEVSDIEEEDDVIDDVDFIDFMTF